MSETVIINEEDRQRLIAEILAAPVGATVKVSAPAKRRSLSQNNALHLWCKMVGINLNNAGYDMRKIMDKDYELSWDDKGYMVKQNLWSPVQLAMTGLDSSTKPEPSQYIEIYENVNRRLPVHTPWPSLR